MSSNATFLTLCARFTLKNSKPPHPNTSTF